MSPGPNLTIRLSHRFRATPERVFDAWLDPATVGRWLFATPTGKMVRVEIDPRVGGFYTIVECRNGEDAVHFGMYLEIDRPRRLVFTLGAEKDSQAMDPIVIEILPTDTGGELTLTHTLQPKWAEYRDRTEQGWTSILEGLAGTLG